MIGETKDWTSNELVTTNEKSYKRKGYIVDISDLHFDENIDEENEAYLLIKDLKKVYFDNVENTLRLQDIDYVVVSGDFVNFGNSQISFEKAFHFIDILSKKLMLPYNKIIIVPGNHDLSWDVTMSSYHLTQGIPGPNDKVVTNVGTDIFYLKRNEEEWNKKFTNYSKYLYEKLYGEPFPDNPKEQLKVISGDFIDNKKIAFFMLNTAANIDQFNRQVTYFDVDGLIKASRMLPKENFIKIAVGHHPVELTNGYGKDIPFANAMQNENFKIYMHGHVHRTISLDYLNPQNINPNMIMIGAGALSATQGSLWPGVPERYNVVRIEATENPCEIYVSVNTRQREYIGAYWQPAYIYYKDDGKKLTNIWNNII
ncbi:metallophosphoesterase [Clostridium sp. 'White wine YQ']|uniref:metallophosphoesterase n=1 Tax=Clostridium sp. 'White wine YQ' TaxID=3027474 RepID=UPI0023673083|nr:metallophosphoesterase [Clostridium sp. 'White wine YQ']MDD7793386.1 metallophosphoesterase [Clostridium sp. 'White wine YQ']